MQEKTNGQIRYEAWKQQLARWARDGDLDAILRDLVEHPDDDFDTPARLKALGQALAVVAQRGPEPILDTLFAQMLAVCLGVHTQAMVTVQQHLRGWYDDGGDKGHLVRLRNHLLPDLERLQLHTCQIARTYAGVKRNLRLAERGADDIPRASVARQAEGAGEGTEPAPWRKWGPPLDDLGTPAIPTELRVRLEALKDLLAGSGAVVCRNEPDRRRSWRLRYRTPRMDGRRAHRSIRLPDEPVAKAVQALVAGWQQQRRQELAEARQAKAALRQAQKRARQRHRRLRQRVVALASGGRRRRRRIGRLYNEAAARGLEEDAAFILDSRYWQANRRPGRCRRGGLVLVG